ncbi:conserved hypothetical protein [Methanocaldococcus sp. FS406-22]|uniref:hypothetical protein n=1 Tax=Methanocaldococcus sp. (strain FS406-22) TaxID=644281 RepID=UPI0001BF53FC|nr:hypothetical protein [Methanocaldococcus sp. FS406-22]ADC69436.1 conserved hypothetical protein [Methanocaldococcus sp. FS406-22]
MKKLFFIFIIAVLLCGCTTNKTTNVNNEINSSNNIETNENLENETPIQKTEKEQLNEIKEIKYMYIVKEGNKTKIQFAFAYENGSLAKVNSGKVILEIFDDSGLLFKKTYDVNNLPIKANYYYEIELPKIKGFYSNAKFVLTYEYNNMTLSKTNYGTIERYSPEEMKEIFEKEYHENSVKTNIEEFRDEVGIKFTVKEFGYYKFYNNQTDKIEDAFRVDFTAKNLNSDSYLFSPKEVCLISGDEKYWKIGGLDEVEIGINQEINGYWVFRKPDNIEGLRLDFKIGDIVYDIPLTQNK